MRRHGLPRGTLWLLLAGMLVLPWASKASSRVFEFLYIDASEGSASGGHAAIKFGDEVFHFQHVEPGFLRARRDDFSGFQFSYGYQENRTIQGHRIEVADDVYQTLREAFSRRLLIQNQQFAALKDLRDDLRLLAELKQASSGKPAQASIDLDALGYFVSDYQIVAEGQEAPPEVSKADPQLALLKQRVVSEYGESFLRQKRRETWHRLKTLRPSLSGAEMEIAEDRFKPGWNSFSRHYKNHLLNLAALDILESGMPPHPDTFLTGDSPGFSLSPEAIAKLADFRQTLFNDLVKLMRSERSDWGYPLLVGMARLHALNESIVSGKLVVLDRFKPDGDDNKSISVDADNLPAVLKYAENIEGRTAGRLSRSEALDERGYDEIEVNASVLSFIHNAVQSRQDFMLPAVNSTPSMSARVELVPLLIVSSDLDAFERLLTLRREAYSEKLQSLYRYQLMNRNCVTEIFRVINASLGQKYASRPDGAEPLASDIRHASEQLLGGYIDDKALNIIPFVAFEQVGSRYRLHSGYRLASYREQQIERQYQSDADNLVDLAESNILTSNIYRWHGEDAAFLFFTQDAVWPRPLLGSANLAVALGQAIYGVFALPWDSGQNLQKSLKGIGVSLPELFFFNIRKGSFPQLIPGVTGMTDSGG
ncbi:MAG: hypothetical protein ACXV7F_08485 [Methylomonas sp.]